MKTKTIRQSASIKASAKEVYDLLMDERKHSSLTGTTVKMSQEVNGKFEAFDGYCHGYNIELEEGKKIVQAWHFQEDGWPDDHYSICTFIFEPTEKGTRIIFIQTGVPENKYEELKDGWKEYYWAPMAAQFKPSGK